MKQQSVKAQVASKMSFDSFGKNKDGNYVLRYGFFYTHGITSAHLAAKLQAALPSAVIVNHGEVWKQFSGRASVANSSHWYVEFYVAPKPAMTEQTAIRLTERF